MKKFLPRTNKNTAGFTLVELLVVISIIAILSVIGITVFSNTQKNARDARRRADIDAIAKALEIKKSPTGASYNALVPTDFAGNSIPQDSGNGTTTYCAYGAGSGSAPTPAGPWTNNPCNTGLGSQWATPGTNPVTGSVVWSVCASLETGSGANGIYCKTSTQ